MNIAIVDDEHIMQNWMMSFLCEHFPEDDFTAFSNGEEFLRCQKEFDGVFLDMDLPGEKGYQIAHQITTPHCCVCYVTSHEETARLGYCSLAIGFILKDQMIKEHLLEYMTIMKERSLKLHLHTEDGYADIPLSSILFAEVYYKQFFLHLKTQRCIRILNMNLTKFLAQSGDGFIKINQSQVIHKTYVKRVDDSALYLQNESQPFYISRNERRKVIKALYE